MRLVRDTVMILVREKDMVEIFLLVDIIMLGLSYILHLNCELLKVLESRSVASL